jgi:hypothetical protein
MSLQHLKCHIDMCLLCSSANTWREHNNKTFWYAKVFITPYCVSAKWWYVFSNPQPSIFCSDNINFLLIAFCGSGFWSAAVRQTGDSLVAIPEVFHRKSHSADTHRGISTDITKFITNICSRTVLLYIEFDHSMLAQQCTLHNHFVSAQALVFQAA